MGVRIGFITYVAIAFFACGAMGVFALEASAKPESDEWSFRFMPYFWLVAQRGDQTVHGFTTKIDLSINDSIDLLTDHFGGAFAGNFEARYRKLSLFTDIMYIRLEGEREVAAGVTTADFNQGIFEFGGAYSFYERPYRPSQMGIALEPLAGVRVQYLGATYTRPLGLIDLDDNRTWVDGFAGARARFQINDWLTAFIRGDVGTGESDYTINGMGGFDLRMNKAMSFVLGYRAFDTNYSDGHGRDKFGYDMLLHGPFFALALHW